MVETGFFLVTPMVIEFGQEMSNIFSPESSVATIGDSVGLYYPPVTPSSYRVAMDMEELSNLSYR